MTLSMRQVPLKDLSPYPGNPRRGDVDAIAQSLETNGQYRPVVVQKSTGHVLAGNHTVLAAESLGWKKIAAVFVDVDDDQAAKIVLADNKTAELGSYDHDDLVALLQSVDNLDGTGYSQVELDAVIHLTDVFDMDELAELVGEPTEDDELTRFMLVLPRDAVDLLNAAILDTGLPEPQSHAEVVRRLL